MKRKIIFLLVYLLALDVFVGRSYSQVKNHFDIQTRKQIEASGRIITQPFHHGFKPNSQFVDFFGRLKANYSINSLGFRDRKSRTIQLKTENYRIVFLGDSFTEGIGFAYPDTFVGIVDEALSQEGIEVLNAAVASYSPIIYYRKTKYLIEEVGLHFDELVVYMDLSDIYDEVERYEWDEKENVITKRRDGQDQKDSKVESMAVDTVERPRRTSISRWFITKLDHNSLIFRLSSTFYRWWWIHQHSSPNENSSMASWSIDETAYEAYGQRGLEKAEKNMERLLELLRAHDIKLTVAVYPWPTQIVRKSELCKQLEFWEGWARRHGVDLINHYPDFMNRASTEQTIKRYFIQDDCHWNKQGHRLIASRFLTHFRTGRPDLHL